MANAKEVYTMTEVGAIFFSLNQTAAGEQRKFAFTDLGKAADVSKKLSPAVVDNKIKDEDHTIDFSTDEKSFIKEHVEEMEWAMDMGEHVLSLVEKLG